VIQDVPGDIDRCSKKESLPGATWFIDSFGGFSPFCPFLLVGLQFPCSRCGNSEKSTREWRPSIEGNITRLCSTVCLFY
jgi:hypothetical protein